MEAQPETTALRRPRARRSRGVVLAVVMVLVALGSGALALVVTPTQSVTAGGQTIEVGAASPSWTLSGPGELSLFGQQIPTTVDFVGPVRPKLVLTRISLTDQLDQFVSSGLGPAGHELEHALVSGWKDYFFWQTVVTGLIALALFGAMAGWLRRSPKATASLMAVGLALALAFDLGATMVTAYTVPSRLRTVDSLEELVGGAPPPSLNRHISTARTTINRVVVVGDSVAAGKGNALVPHATEQDRICNRSRDAFPAALGVSSGWQVVNLACSGASIRAGLLGPQHAAGHRIPPQLRNPAVAKADLIVVNVGADDVHWDVLLGLCAVSRDCANSAQRAFLQQQLANFSRDLLHLFSQLQLLDNHPTVVVNQYYDPFPDDISCLVPHGLTEAKRGSLEDQLGALNTILKKGAEAAGFHVATPNFAGHGVCSAQPYVQGLHADAPFHPTPSGQLAIALAVEDALHLHVLPESATQTPTPTPTPVRPSGGSGGAQQ
ncbi:GDSL-type esterase/lipase family protein [Nocardioides terrisoli]|uniref:GDSL-type esterase/lipase family protein n=1 Tax=Nocardioides terrisoli TaxID=3388267 RepID=UPI00287BBC04|nr:GDSL-type esterase/lipase family protein [Nocardioides marmorisolisilvae]